MPNDSQKPAQPTAGARAGGKKPARKKQPKKKVAKNAPKAAAKTRKKSSKESAPKKHNVLITGATSTLGRQLCERLLYDKSVGQVWGLSRREMPYYFRDFDPGRFVFRTCAPTNDRKLIELCKSEEFLNAKIDTIIHLAFQIGRSDAHSQARDYNIRGTRNLLEIARETPSVKKFVFLSSAKVYRLPRGHVEVIHEGSPLNYSPEAEPFVRDLIDADLLCQDEIERNPRLKTIVLRPTYMVGRNVHSFFSYYFESPMCPYVSGTDPLINLIHSSDVIRALQISIHKPISGVFNLPGRDTKTLKEFVELTGHPRVPVPDVAIGGAWEAVRRLRWNKHRFPLKATPLRCNCVLSGERAKLELGFEPERHVKFAEG